MGDEIRTFTGELSFLGKLPTDDDAGLGEEGEGLLAEEVWAACEALLLSSWSFCRRRCFSCSFSSARRSDTLLPRLEWSHFTLMEYEGTTRTLAPAVATSLHTSRHSSPLEKRDRGLVE